MSSEETFKELAARWRVADRMIERSSKADIAEVARQAADARRFGELVFCALLIAQVSVSTDALAQQPRVATEACARAAGSKALLQSSAKLSTISGNLTNLLRANSSVPDYEYAQGILQAGSSAEDLLLWLHSVGFIASNMESPTDARLARQILQNDATTIHQMLREKVIQVNLGLAHLRSPVLVAEARDVRSEIEKVLEALKPCE